MPSLFKESILAGMLQLVACKKNYGGREILNIPTFELQAGSYWLQGVNGAGKTTLLRMIAGMIPFKGDMLLDGISLHKSPRLYRRKLSWAESEPRYPAFVTGDELVGLYLEIRKTGAKQVAQLLTAFQMQPYMSAVTGSYSSGMIKKLSLLLAFIGQPQLMLLDEPLATLDNDAAGLLPSLIRQYQDDFGTSFIFSSHQAIGSDQLPLDKKLNVVDCTLQFSA